MTKRVNPVDMPKAEHGMPPPPPLEDMADDPEFLRWWTRNELDITGARGKLAADAADDLAKSGEIPAPEEPKAKPKGRKRRGEDELLRGIGR